MTISDKLSSDIAHLFSQEIWAVFLKALMIGLLRDNGERNFIKVHKTSAKEARGNGTFFVRF